MSTIAALQELGLPADTIKALRKKARSRGQTTPQYIRTLIETDVLAECPFDEILRPVREGFQNSGLDQQQLLSLFNEARTRRRSTRR